MIGLILIVVPGIDLGVSRLFFLPDANNGAGGFAWSGAPAAELGHWLVQRGSLVLGAGLVLAFLYCAIRLRRLGGLGSVQWLFLVLALVVGPGLVVNMLFKDEWGRARPSQIQEFGGTRQFTPPLVLSNQCDHNCSFVSGDPSVGFVFHAFAYVARRRQRAIVGASVAAGLVIGLMRIGQGAHFFSDVLFAGVAVFAATAAVHALLFGRSATVAWWRTHMIPARSAA
jgi:lipid A 4'-phosphatase